MMNNKIKKALYITIGEDYTIEDYTLINEEYGYEDTIDLTFVINVEEQDEAFRVEMNVSEDGVPLESTVSVY